MAAAEVDVGYVSGHLGLPEAVIAAALSDPTVELIKTIILAIATKAVEYNELHTEKLQLEIELEATARSAEERCEAFKGTADKAVKETEGARRKLQEEESARQAAERALQDLQSATSTSSAQVETLKQRVESLETSNRETMGVLDAKNRTNLELSDELQRQHQKNVELNKEVTNLQQQTLAAQSASSSAKFREQTLKQELELVRRNEEFAKKELLAKSTEAMKYRKEKGARIAELQRQLDDASAEVDSLRRNELQLRRVLEETQRKADQTLLKVQQLENAAADAKENFRQELEGQKRIVQMKDEHTATHLNRVKELEGRLEKVQDESEREVRRARQELEQEKADREEILQRIEELDRENSELRARGPPADMPGSAPQTPRPLNGSFLGRAASPFATPGSLRGKTITTTQAIDEFYKVKTALIDERKKTETLSNQLDEVMSSLEAAEPELTELRAENQRLVAEAAEMSHLAEDSYKERDAARRAQRKADAAHETSLVEIKILQSQLRDLSTQIQMLVFNLHAHEKGMDQLSMEEAAHFERLSRGEPTDDALEDMSDTHQLITQRFVVFKDIRELQTKNQELLKVTRDLANQMESDEAAKAKQQAAKDHEEVQQLRAKTASLMEELQSLTVMTKTYMSERDIFRRMLQNKASAAEINSSLGLSMDNREVLASIEQPHGSNEEPDYSTLLRELQSNFDAYRNEQTTDRTTMREQISQLSKEKGELQAKVAKAESHVTLATERYGLLSANLEALQRENAEAQKRSHRLSEAAAKQDIKTQHVTEELVETKVMLESLRSENSNLKAEKSLWRNIQDRLSQDNETLVQDKASLNSQLATQQALANQKDLTTEEATRRLREQIGELQTELGAVQRKLADEGEESKKLQLRHSYDVAQSQKRIDDLVSQLGAVREELVGAKASRDHLQIRVDELTIKLKSAEERSRLQPRPTPRPFAANPDDVAALEEAETRVAELENTVADLRRDLALGQQHLENVEAQVTRYKELAQTFESDLTSLREAHEEYEAEMTSTLDAKEATIKELGQRKEDLSAELATTNSQLSAIRDSQADLTRRFDDEKSILESEIQRLKDNIEQHSESQSFHNQDMHAQADIALKAQQAYEVELLRHAEAAKALQALRGEFNQLKTDAAKWKADAEAARVLVSQNEHSWEERRQLSEKEMSDLKARRDDMSAQNKLLQQQLDNVTAQISSLQTSRASQADAPSGIPAALANSATEGLRELNSYLRREKEILEIQYSVQIRETNRIKSELEYAKVQLDEERLKLEQERRENADSGRSSMAHKDLMEKLNELNVFRESSATLRAEARQAEAKVAEKEARIQELESRILPMESRIEELQSQKTFQEENLKQLQEDRDRWQKRTESILSKYDRVDPAEMEQLKASLAEVQAQKDALQKTLDAKNEELETEKNTWKLSRERLINQAKERSRQQTAQNNDLTAQKNEVQQQLDAAKVEMSAKQQEVDNVTKQKQAADDQVKNYQRQIETLNQQAQANAGTVASAAASTAVATASEELAQMQQQIAGLRAEAQKVNDDKAKAQQSLDQLKAELASATESRDKALAAAAAAAISVVKSTGDAVIQNGVDHASADAAPATAASEQAVNELQQKLAASEARAEELAAKLADIEGNNETTLGKRSEKMKEALNKKLRESRERMEQELQDTRKKLDDDFQLRLDQEKIIWMSENKAPPIQSISTPIRHSDEGDAATPATPTAAIDSADLSRLTDPQIREFLANNPTVKNIVAANIRNRIGMETKKIQDGLKTEYDQKIAQATMMESKKSQLRISMAENKLRTANAKLGVVETAAKETPEQPVGEVWEVAKDTKAPPPPPAAQQASAGGPASLPRYNPPDFAPVQSQMAPIAVATTPAQMAAANPFANHFAASGGPQPNPFVAAQQAPGPVAGAVQIAQGLPHPPSLPALPVAGAHQQQQQPGRATGIPVPATRGGGGPGNRGARGGGGVYQAPRGGGNHQTRGGGGGGGGGGGANRGGHGGGRGGGAQGALNPSAGEFNPGSNKRPRNDSEAGTGVGGPKRQRGGAGGGGQ